MQIRRGITRTVFIFKHFVIKVPSVRYRWKFFVQGFCANLKESQTWRKSCKTCGKSYLLCPVLWCSWVGCILIMARADVDEHMTEMESITKKCTTIDQHQELRKVMYRYWIDAGFGGDDKPDNYGYYTGRLVKIDYA